MENAVNPTFAQIHDKTLTGIQVRQEQVKHVVSLLDMNRDSGQFNIVLRRPVFERQFISLP